MKEDGPPVSMPMDVEFEELEMVEAARRHLADSDPMELEESGQLKPGVKKLPGGGTLTVEEIEYPDDIGLVYRDYIESGKPENHWWNNMRWWSEMVKIKFGRNHHHDNMIRALRTEGKDPKTAFSMIMAAEQDRLGHRTDQKMIDNFIEYCQEEGKDIDTCTWELSALLAILRRE